MFTGIIQTTGSVVSLSGSGTRRLTVATALASQLHRGDSIAINGTCLTAVEITAERFSADLLEETLQRTTLGQLRSGTRVNVELPTPAGTPLGGHIVQGHVDGVGKIARLGPEHTDAQSWRLHIVLPTPLMRYIAEKGSIAIDGISLTVAAIVEDGIEISIIPHTYDNTNLSSRKIGDAVNIELDALAKYAERLQSRTDSFALTLDFLVARGY